MENLTDSDGPSRPRDELAIKEEKPTSTDTGDDTDNTSKEQLEQSMHFEHIDNNSFYESKMTEEEKVGEPKLTVQLTDEDAVQEALIQAAEDAMRYAYEHPKPRDIDTVAVDIMERLQKQTHTRLDTLEEKIMGIAAQLMSSEIALQSKLEIHQLHLSNRLDQLDQKLLTIRALIELSNVKPLESPQTVLGSVGNVFRSAIGASKLILMFGSFLAIASLVSTRANKRPIYTQPIRWYDLIVD
jgi:hypothetical protein